jgi:hypothetical protein
LHALREATDKICGAFCVIFLDRYIYSHNGVSIPCTINPRKPTL